MPAGHALLNQGFRLFFLLAALFAVVAVLAWSGVYVLGWHWPRADFTALTWHAHEMIYGYTMAVIAGFLLAAVKNWTGVQTLHGVPLLLLGLAWLAARILMLVGDTVPPSLAALADGLFNLALTVVVAWPVFRVRQWQQLGMVSKLFLLACSNQLFYAGLLGFYPDGIRAGLYSGVYLVMALIFVMARRVLPFFIERAMDPPATPVNRVWLDRASLALFLVFWLIDILHPDALPVALLASVLCVLHGMRLSGWHVRGILGKPLLAVLYLGYGWLVIGFALKAAVFAGIPPSLALHAFTYGGIGLFTLGMMARVTLGHTGRSVQQPPPVVGWSVIMLLAGVAVRVLLPLLDAGHYLWWVGLAQLLWVAAFAMFLVVFLPMWLGPRVDGQPG